MQKRMVVVLWCVVGGVYVEAPCEYESVAAAVAVVAKLLGVWGVGQRKWVKAGPHVRTMGGPEAGGWCVVLLQAWCEAAGGVGAHAGPPLAKGQSLTPKPKRGKGKAAVPGTRLVQ